MESIARRIKQLATQVSVDIETRLLYPENCYQILLQKLLQKEGFSAEIEVDVFYKTKGGISFGQGRIDILVTTEKGMFILELKANTNFSMKYKAIYQTQRYLKHFNSELPSFGIVIMYNCIKDKSKWSRSAIQIYDVVKF